jgi:ABC-type glycerol-3-phosphate transport system substrate-binding protein
LDKVNIHHYYRILREKSRHLLKKLKNLGENLVFQIKKLRYLGEKLGYQIKKLRYLGEKARYLIKRLRYFGEKLRYLVKKLRYRIEDARFFEKSSDYLIRKLKYGAEKLRQLATRVNGKRVIDVFLGFAAVVVVVMITTNRACDKSGEPRRMAQRIDISISPQCRNLFGSDTVDALIREFEEKNPGLRIQEAAPDGQADIVFFDDSGFGSPAAYLQVETLVSFMDLFFYNIDILKAVNLDRPPKTRAEFLAAARAVAKYDTKLPSAETVFPFALGFDPSDPMALRRDFFPWVWANGGNMPPLGTSDEETTLSRPFTEIITFFEQLNRDELLAPETFEKTGAQRLKEFAEGKIAMITASARDIAFVKNNADDITFGITTIPSTSQGKTRMGLLNIYAGINSACALPDEARTFLAFIVEKNQVLAEAAGAVPGSFPIAFPGAYIAENPLYSKAWDIFEAADIVEYKPSHLFDKEIDSIIREKLKEVLE